MQVCSAAATCGQGGAGLHGLDVHWRTERYGIGHPFLTRAAAEHLITFVRPRGIDSLNIDDATDGGARTLVLSGRGSRSSNTCAAGRAAG